MSQTEVDHLTISFYFLTQVCVVALFLFVIERIQIIRPVGSITICAERTQQVVRLTIVQNKLLDVDRCSILVLEFCVEIGLSGDRSPQISLDGEIYILIPANEGSQCFALEISVFSYCTVGCYDLCAQLVLAIHIVYGEGSSLRHSDGIGVLANSSLCLPFAFNLSSSNLDAVVFAYRFAFTFIVNVTMLNESNYRSVNIRGEDCKGTFVNQGSYKVGRQFLAINSYSYESNVCVINSLRTDNRNGGEGRIPFVSSIISVTCKIERSQAVSGCGENDPVLQISRSLSRQIEQGLFVLVSEQARIVLTSSTHHNNHGVALSESAFGKCETEVSSFIHFLVGRKVGIGRTAKDTCYGGSRTAGQFNFDNLAAYIRSGQHFSLRSNPLVGSVELVAGTADDAILTGSSRRIGELGCIGVCVNAVYSPCVVTCVLSGSGKSSSLAYISCSRTVNSNFGNRSRLVNEDGIA